MRMRLTILTMVLTSLMTGCPPVMSGSIDTDALYISYRITEVGDTVLVRAEFRVGNALGTLLELSEGDDLRVNGVAMAYRALLIPHYEGTVVPADTYSFVLTRPGEGPYTSTVSAPMPVSITSPAADTTLSRSTDFTVTWDDPANTGLYFSSVGALEQGCALFTGSFVEDLRAYSYMSEDFQVPAEEGEGTVPICEGQTVGAELAVESIAEGTMADELGGLITAHTRVSIEISLTP